MNMLNDMLTSQQELAMQRDREQKRRQGHKFIKILYIGDYQFPDPRIHDVHDIIGYDSTDPDSGKPVYKTRPGTSTLLFDVEPSTGDRVAFLLSDDYNRQWLANHLHIGIKCADERDQVEIEKLVGKTYKVEVGRKEELIREKRRIERELAGIDDEVEEDGAPDTGETVELPGAIAPSRGTKKKAAKKRGRKKGTKMNATALKRKAQADALNQQEEQADKQPEPSEESAEE